MSDFPFKTQCCCGATFEGESLSGAADKFQEAHAYCPALWANRKRELADLERNLQARRSLNNELRNENTELREYADSLTEYLSETDASRVPTFEEWRAENE